jgi:molybdenum cofactor cytidylyltransferase
MANIGAVILAAGESSRFGQPKQLIRFRGQTLLRRVVDEAIQAGCAPIVVVIGSDREKISAELISDDVVLVANENWKLGIGSSIRAGVRALIEKNSGQVTDDEISAIVLLVCDQPFVDSGVIRSLIALRDKTGKAIVASSYSRTLGVPALFDRICFRELRTLADDSGAKPIILANPERVAKFSFPEGARDIDTSADYDAAASQPPR